MATGGEKQPTFRTAHVRPLAGIFAMCGHNANYYFVHPKNTPENHPPIEACMINSKHGCKIHPWDPWLRVVENRQHNMDRMDNMDRIWNGRSDLQAGVEIYNWGYLRFWLILSSQNEPFLGPQFQAPVWSIGGPISLCPCGART